MYTPQSIETHLYPFGTLGTGPRRSSKGTRRATHHWRYGRRPRAGDLIPILIMKGGPPSTREPRRELRRTRVAARARIRAWTWTWPWPWLPSRPREPSVVRRRPPGRAARPAQVIAKITVPRREDLRRILAAVSQPSKAAVRHPLAMVQPPVKVVVARPGPALAAKAPRPRGPRAAPRLLNQEPAVAAAPIAPLNGPIIIVREPTPMVVADARPGPAPTPITRTITDDGRAPPAPRVRAEALDRLAVLRLALSVARRRAVATATLARPREAAGLGRQGRRPRAKGRPARATRSSPQQRAFMPGASFASRAPLRRARSSRAPASWRAPTSGRSWRSWRLDRRDGQCPGRASPATRATRGEEGVTSRGASPAGGGVARPVSGTASTSPARACTPTVITLGASCPKRGPTTRPSGPPAGPATESTGASLTAGRCRRATRGVGAGRAPKGRRPSARPRPAALTRGAKTFRGAIPRTPVPAIVSAPSFVLKAGPCAPAPQAASERGASRGTGAGGGGATQARARGGGRATKGRRPTTTGRRAVGPRVSGARGAISRTAGALASCIGAPRP